MALKLDIQKLKKEYLITTLSGILFFSPLLQHNVLCQENAYESKQEVKIEQVEKKEDKKRNKLLEWLGPQEAYASPVTPSPSSYPMTSFISEPFLIWINTALPNLKDGIEKERLDIRMDWETKPILREALQGYDFLNYFKEEVQKKGNFKKKFFNLEMEGSLELGLKEAEYKLKVFRW